MRAQRALSAQGNRSADGTAAPPNRAARTPTPGAARGTAASPAAAAPPPPLPPPTPGQRAASMERLYARSVQALLARNAAFDRDVADRLGATGALGHVKARAIKHRATPEADNRLYYGPLKQRTDAQRRLLDKFSFDMEVRKYEADNHMKSKLTADDQLELAQRLCNRTMERKQQSLAAAEERAYGKPPLPAVMTREQVRECGMRLCTKSMEDRAKTLGALEEKYLFRRPSTKKVDQAELVSYLAALSTRRGRTA